MQSDVSTQASDQLKTNNKNGKENNKNAHNTIEKILGKPFIPFKIRGRRPSDGYQNRMNAISEEKSN